jgi:hypothetical protein
VPTTLVGLLIFLGFLTPGFLHYIQRRAQVPDRPLSPLLETATLTTISLLTNVLTLGAFGLVRAIIPSHTPDVGRLLGSKLTRYGKPIASGSRYVDGNLPYVLGWAAGILVVSCVLAIVLARSERLRRLVLFRFTPVIYQVSAWYHVFEQVPAGKYVYVGCELTDGAYVGGRLAWYSSETVEAGDRSLVLAPPLTRRIGDDESTQVTDVERMIVSARDIVRMEVSYPALPPYESSEDLRLVEPSIQ